MARSTGPILLVGAVTLANRHLLAKKPASEIDWRIPVGTAIAAGGLALMERMSEPLAVGIAWIALVTILLAEVDPKYGAPAENMLDIFEGKRK